MSSFIKKFFGTLAQKPWEKEQAAIDTHHSGKTFNLSKQTSAVIVIFGLSTVLFSLVLTSYLYTIPPEQDTNFFIKTKFVMGKYSCFVFCNLFFWKNYKRFKKK